MTLNRSATPSGPRLAQLFTLSAVIGGSEDTGQSSLGRRLRDSAGEGTFSGARLRGEVLPGSADWRLVRRDVTTVVDARVMLRTDVAALPEIDLNAALAQLVGGDQGVREFSPDDGSDLGDVLHRRQAVQACEQRGVQR
jgi:hypothetical protein